MDYKNHIEHYQVDGDYYDYFNLDKFVMQATRRRYQEFVNLVKIKKNDNILEIGSGSGELAQHIKNKKFYYFPVDLSHKNLNRIRDLYPHKIYPAFCDAFSLPFKENSIDLVIASEVIEHISRPVEVLKESYRIIKPGGQIIVSVPYKEIITYQICIHCNKPTPTNSHLHSFNQDSLSALMREAGFKVLKLSRNLNKIPNRLHLYLWLRFLPYKLWKSIDTFFNVLADKPASLIIVAKK